MTGDGGAGSAVTAVPVERASARRSVRLMTGPVSVEVTGATGTSSGATADGVTRSGR